MEIVNLQKHGVEELIDNIKRVTMLHDRDAYPYKAAKVELVTMSTDDIAPAQRYVLTQEILKVRDLRWSLAEKGIDLFNLDGYVSIWLQGYDDPIDVLPPVVEESPEADGTVVKILNDGMHRVYLARMERSPIQVIYASGLPKAYPYYAFPLVDGWSGVDIVSELPEDYIKKWHRIKNYKTLYRDFNSGFQNVGGPRGHFTNAGK